MTSPRFAAAKDKLWRWIWPEICAHCREDLRPGETSLCGACVSLLRPVESPFCPRCQAPSPSPHHMKNCLSAPSACHLIRAAFIYNGPLVSLVHAFKYRGRRRAASWAGAKMGTALGAFPELEPYDALVPIPLHARRLRGRGYNQAGILAGGISASSGRPVMELLRRLRPTAEQWRLKRKERLTNVMGAFQAPPEARGLRVLLIDDVCTSGASLEECAKTLLNAGAQSVSAYVLAREAL